MPIQVYHLTHIIKFHGCVYVMNNCNVTGEIQGGTQRTVLCNKKLRQSNA